MLLSRNKAYVLREFVTVASVTTHIRGISVEVPLGPEDGLIRPCVANLDTINTIPKQTLTERITMLSPEKLASVDQALKYALALE